MPFRSTVGACLTGLALAMTAPASAQQFEDPIGLTGHGTLFDPQGRAIDATPEFLAETLNFYRDALLERVDAETRREVTELRERMERALPGDATPAGRRLALIAQAEDVAIIAARQRGDDAIDTHVDIIRYLLETGAVEGMDRDEVPAGLRAIFDEVRLEPGIAVASSTVAEGPAYIAECAANGVPIPPDWGSSAWIATGSLSDAEEFISQASEARPFKFQSTSPPGGCIALPRFMNNGAGDISLLGIICQGDQTGKVCFWDNQSNDMGFVIGANEDVPLSEFAGGAELDQGTGGTCTACHAGENPFIIHPGTALGLPALGDFDFFADVWADPLVHPDWPQNAGPSALVDAIPGVGQCTSCHQQGGTGGRFPQLSQDISGYCGTILPKVVGAVATTSQPTMPPGSAGSAATSAHVEAMLDLCDSIAAPLLRIENEVLNYGEVELGFAFAKALVLHNDGNASLTVSVDLATPGDPDLAHWSEITESPSVTLAPGEPPLVLRQTYEPQSLGSHSIELEVTSNDSSAPATLITLVGSGDSPTPIDSLLVLDRSGSMSDLAGDRTKIEAMRDAVMLYTDLLRPAGGLVTAADGLGFVRYNDANSVYMSMTQITETVQDDIRNDELSDAAIGDLNRLRPDGTTGIGGAMLTGAGELGGPDPDRGKVMIVLTDGIENVAPFISEAVDDLQANDPHIQTYSVGLGFDVEPAKLQSITNMGTEGYHQVVSTLSDTSLFDLETFYFKIFSSATGMDLVTDPTHIVNLASADPVVVDRARVISSDRSATFLVLDDPMMRQLYALEFVAPDGSVLVAGSTVGGIPIHEQTRNTYRIFRIVFPDPSQAETYVGDWTLTLVPRGTWTEVVGRNLAAESRFGYGGFMHPMQGQVPIGFAGAVASDYHLEVELAASEYLPGATLDIRAALTDRGWPAPDGSVTVTVTRPDGAVHVVDLADDGAHGDGDASDAVWGGSYAQTAVPGVYKLLFRSVGHNERGELAPRLAERYVTLAQLEPDPVDPGGGTQCRNCEGSASAYLVGRYDMRAEIKNLVHVINPTADGLEFVVSLFTEDGQPVRCDRGRIPPNGIRQIEIGRLDPPDGHGVVKIVSFRPGTRTPAIGLVGNQSTRDDRGVTETNLHAVSREILRRDLPRILEACR